MSTPKKHTRNLSVLTAVCVTLSLLLPGELSAVALGTLPQKNTTQRHQVCSELSWEALDYYSGDYSYENLSKLSGAGNNETSYDAAQNNQLYDALHKLMSDTHTYYTTYSGYGSSSLAYFWASTDATSDTDSYVMFYSDVPSGEGVTMNREHVWPKSHASYYQLNGGADLHHLRPSVNTLNSAKNDHMFGDVNGVYTDGYTEGKIGDDVVYYLSAGRDLFECKDDVKGDVARILLYVYCRWEQPNLYTDMSENLPPLDSDDSMNKGGRVIESLDTLLRWCEQDPVDTWEMKRNDLTQEVQGNRNVFIDYPEFAWQLFGEEPPAGMATPTSEGCNHHYVLIDTIEPTCELEGTEIYKCDNCGNEMTKQLSAYGHTDADSDDICDVCGTELVIFANMRPAQSLSEGDHLILYHTSTKSTFSETPDGKSHLTATSVEIKNGVINPPDGCAAFKVHFADENSFYLLRKGMYLTTGAEGSSLSLEETPNDCSLWTLTPYGTNGQFFIDNVNAGNNGNTQRLEIYRGYGTAVNAGTTPAFRFELYTSSEHLWEETIVLPSDTEDGSKTDVCRLCGDTHEETIPAGSVISGDIDGDSIVSISDATAIQRHIAGIGYLSGITLKLADYNRDGRVDINDVTALQKLIAYIDY